MECKDARLLLEFLRPGPGELSTDDAACLEQHLAGCPVCRSLADTRERFDTAVGKAMTAVAVPEGLRTRLMARLDAERDRWYRGLLSRCAAVAACLTLVFGLGWYWWAGLRPEFHLDPAVEFVMLPVGQPEGEVTAWLQEVGGKQLAAPPDFRYGPFLQKRGLDRLQGRSVPFLLFVRSEGKATYFAHVYVLSDSQFNLASLPTNVPIGGTSANVRVLLYPNLPQLRFLVVYTGDLREFLEKPQLL